MNNQNRIPVQKAMDRLLESIAEEGQGKPKLLLHSCCAPCSSYVLEYLSASFEIYDFFYNPNISPDSEYRMRAGELKRLIKAMSLEDSVHFVEGVYEPERFYQAVKGYEHCPERGARCEICFRLRLEESAKMCRELGCRYFATTLTISPLKEAQTINRIGTQLGKTYGVEYLPSDFKKKNGYKRSIELSDEYDLYRQNFCGCVFSKGEKHE
ncbi:MAG: epoxyqueuosine reductase QueH [Lachnospiraceae bacterium]